MQLLQEVAMKTTGAILSSTTDSSNAASTSNSTNFFACIVAKRAKAMQSPDVGQEVETYVFIRYINRSAVFTGISNHSQTLHQTKYWLAIKCICRASF